MNDGAEIPANATPTDGAGPVPPPPPAPPAAPRKPMTARHESFAAFIAKGKTHTDAYRAAYGKWKLKSATARHSAHRILRDSPAILERVKELLAKSELKTILSVNDRFAILAKDAQLPGDSPAMVNARARVVEVYNRMAGDQAPERVETTVKGDPASPVQIVTRTATKAEKFAALRASRETAFNLKTKETANEPAA